MSSVTHETRRALLLAAAAGLAIVSSGCASLSLSAVTGWSSALPTPTRLVLLVASRPMEPQGGQGAHPGLLARLYVFAGADPTPIQTACETTLVVMGKSADGREAPVGRYVIAGSEMASHLRRDIVGDSYVFWLPIASTAYPALLAQCGLKLPDGQELYSSVVSVDLDPPTSAIEVTQSPAAAPSEMH